MEARPTPRPAHDLVLLDGLIVRSRGDDPRERRACARGELVRVAPGRYVSQGEWKGLRPEERNVLRTLARLPRLHEDVVVSHLSAAALWGLPLVGSTTADRTTVTDPRRTTARYQGDLVRHADHVPRDRVLEIGRLRVTSPERTLVDVALTSSRMQGVAALDAALASGLVTREAYVGELLVSTRERGRAKAAWGGTFADPLAQSAGESAERVLLDGLGFPAPVLQMRHIDDRGVIGYTDFAWPEHGVLAEFDGRRKYVDREMRDGRSIEEVVLDEKRRENRLRARDGFRGFVRTTWSELYLPAQVAADFRRAGLPRVRAALAPLPSRTPNRTQHPV